MKRVPSGQVFISSRRFYDYDFLLVYGQGERVPEVDLPPGRILEDGEYFDYPIGIKILNKAGNPKWVVCQWRWLLWKMAYRISCWDRKLIRRLQEVSR